MNGAPDLVVTIPGARIDAMVREEIRAALPIEQVRQFRRELLLTAATISREEGGILLGGIEPRRFAALCADNGVPEVQLGYRTPRYRISAVSDALDKLSHAAKADLEAAKLKLTEISARLMREIDALAA